MNEESMVRGMYKLPHTIIVELRKELEELRRVSKENSEYE